MTDMIFLYPDRIHWIWLLLPLFALLVYLELRGKAKLARFVSLTMQTRLVRQLSAWRRVLSMVFVALTLSFGLVTLMRPQSRHTEHKTSHRVSADVMVVLDVSRSMLAADAAPTRLERAKAELRDMLSSLKSMRLGLIVFAGQASVACPLTTDEGYYNLVLDSVDTESVPRGGTRIGDAIRKALGSFSDDAVGARVILLITDGEDHDSYPIEAAEAARERGIPIVTIGFGSEEGSQIEVTDPQTGGRNLLRDLDGNVVESKLDGATLREIAELTKGVYIPAGTAVLDIESILQAHIRPLLQSESTTVSREQRKELYPWFVFGALLSLFAFALFRSRFFDAR